MGIPGLSAVDKIISDAILHVYDEAKQKIDDKAFALDLSRKIRNQYLSFLIQSTKFVTLIGYNTPVEVGKIFVEPELAEDPNLPFSGQIRGAKERDERIRELRRSKLVFRAFTGLNPRSLVVGPPGVGKSTLAKFITLSASGYVQAKIPILQGRLPFYFAVKDLSTVVPSIHNFDWRLALHEAESDLPKNTYLQRLIELEGEKPKSYIESLMTNLLKQAKCEHAEAFVEYVLEKGKCCIIVDGLDEATDLLREVLIGSLTHISAAYSNNILIAFSRPKAIPDGIYGFSTMGIMEFDSKRALAFSEKWFSNKQSRIEFDSALESDEHIADLAQNPLLISILCLLIDRKYPIPYKRSDLYGRCLDALMFELDRAKQFRRQYKYPLINEQKRKDVLSILAFHMMEEGHQSITRKQIEQQLSGVAFLKELADREELAKFVDALDLEHGVLIEWTRNLFVFPHRTFQEYLSAWHIERTRSEVDFAQRLKTHYGRDLERWREVAIILPFLLYDATPYVLTLMNSAFEYKFKRSILPDILIQDISCNERIFELGRERGYLPRGVPSEK